MTSLTTQKAIAASCQKAAEDAAYARAKVYQLQRDLHAAMSAELEAHDTHKALWNDAVALLKPAPVAAPSAPRGMMPAPTASDNRKVDTARELTEGEILLEHMTRPVAPILSQNACAPAAPFGFQA